MNTCFACGGELQKTYEQGGVFDDDGTHFTAHGNYGSGVFDPMDSSLSLFISICDLCMRERKNRVLLIKTSKPLPTYEHGPWSPEDSSRALHS
jgi:hypothetical protein